MQRFRFFIAVPMAALLVLSGYGASSLLAGASSTPSTYYACLSGGALTKVGTKSPTCSAGAKVISWNQVGPAGPPGAKGDTGAAGPRGEAGAQGLKGDTGASGSKGDAGVKGDTGAKGDIGPQGPKGDVGPQGPKGDIGQTGPSGTVNWPAGSPVANVESFQQIGPCDSALVLIPEWSTSPFVKCQGSSSLSLAAGTYNITYFGWFRGATCRGETYSWTNMSSPSSLNRFGNFWTPNMPTLVTVGSGGGTISVSCKDGLFWDTENGDPIVTPKYYLGFFATPTIAG